VRSADRMSQQTRSLVVGPVGGGAVAPRVGKGRDCDTKCYDVVQGSTGGSRSDAGGPGGDGTTLYTRPGVREATRYETLRVKESPARKRRTDDGPRRRTGAAGGGKTLGSVVVGPAFLAPELSPDGRRVGSRSVQRARESDVAPAKAEADRNGGERREHRERRGDAAAGPSGPDRGGGWEWWVRVDGNLRRSPADRRRTSGGAVAGAVAVYTFHLRESNRNSVLNNRERRLAGGSL